MMQRSLSPSSHYCVTMGRFGGAEGQMVRTFGRGRVCAGGCGTVLSVYNRGRLCSVCSKIDHVAEAHSTKRKLTLKAPAGGSCRKVDSAQALERLDELIAHYGTAAAVSRRIGMRDETVRDLVQHRNPRVMERTYLAIMSHVLDTEPHEDAQKLPVPVEMSERLLELFAGGLSYPRMGNMCGLSKTTVRTVANRDYTTATAETLTKIRKLFAILDADTSTDALIFGERTCVKCGATKPLNRDYFQRDIKGAQGYKGTCRDCRNAKDRNRSGAMEVTA